MTILEAHIRTKVLLDKVDSSYYEELLDEEIDEFLDEAFNRRIKRVYGKNNLYQRGFEELQKRTDDLKNLVKSGYCTVSAVPYYQEANENVYRAELSTIFSDIALENETDYEYMFYLKSMAKTCKGTCCKFNGVKLVQQDDITSISDDPFNKPSAERPIVFFEDSDVFVWTGSDTLDSFLVTFLKKPKKVNKGTYDGQDTTQEFEAPSHFVEEVVVDAVQIMIETLESKRIQSHTQNLNLTE
jgi:hypothetical protein